MRVPTYATNMNLLKQTMSTKSMLDLYAFQATTGLKSPNYTGYGMDAYGIVSMEATSTVTTGFQQTNKLLNIEFKTMNTSMETINKSLSDFKSMLTSFGSSDLTQISPDYTGGSITFSSNDDVYLNKTLTLDGIQYTFADNGDGNNIDISGLTAGSDTYAQDVMNALKDKVAATNPDFSFEGTTFTFPLYTVNGSSSVLNAEGVTTGTPHTMNDDQYKNMRQLQQQAFAMMSMLADALNVNVNGKYLFGGGNSNVAPVSFPFTTLEEFQNYYDGINIKYPDSGSANLTNRTFTAADTGSLTIQKTSGNQGVLKAENAGGFMQEILTANAETTGSLTFNSDKNSLQATQYGAFAALKPGDTMIISDAGDTHNGAYVVKSVSEDGKTITFEESTPIRADDQIVDGGGAKINTSLPIGSVINMDGFDKNIAPTIQVTGVSADGSEIYFTAAPNRIPDTETTIAASSKWSMSTQSYYKGGDFASEKHITMNQSVTMDITGNNPAFEKLFRALGQVAQGNIVEDINPADDFEGLINSNHTDDIITEVFGLIQSAEYNSGNTTNELNTDLYTVNAKLSANITMLATADKSLASIQYNLENSIQSLKNVDQTEATVKALLALNNLNASYQVLQSVMSTSLLNYLK